LKKLSFFNISSNKLESLPNSFERLEVLEYLNISNNKISELKVDLKGLKKLKTFLYINNSLTVVPTKCKESSTKMLDLSSNNIVDADLTGIEMENVE
jgi:Leucine-rich repeat (LRR) protein